MERGALRAAGRARLVSALGGGVGAHWRNAVGAVRWRASCGSDKAGLSRDTGTAREKPSGPGTRTGAGAVTWDVIRDQFIPVAAAARHRLRSVPTAPRPAD